MISPFQGERRVLTRRWGGTGAWAVAAGYRPTGACPCLIPLVRKPHGPHQLKVLAQPFHELQ
jgi:hypothetical protein